MPAMSARIPKPPIDARIAADTIRMMPVIRLVPSRSGNDSIRIGVGRVFVPTSLRRLTLMRPQRQHDDRTQCQQDKRNADGLLPSPPGTMATLGTACRFS
jgi:hypothetical protein